MREKHFLKVKKNLFKLKKDFIKLNDKELIDKELKIKKEMRKLFSKLIIVSIDNINKFEQKEMKKIKSIKNTWYDWQINYIPKRIRKSAGGFKDKVINFFKKNTPKQRVHGRGKKLSKSTTQSKIRNPFILTKKKEREKLKIK